MLEQRLMAGIVRSPSLVKATTVPRSSSENKGPPAGKVKHDAEEPASTPAARAKPPGISQQVSTKTAARTQATPSRQTTTTSQVTPSSLDKYLEAPATVLYNRYRKTNKPIHDNYPTVIYMDDKWTDVSCGVCGANASYRKKDDVMDFYFYGGFMGVLNHVRTAHKGELDISIANTLRTCNRRLVSDEDIALMRKGKDPKVKIPMSNGKQILVKHVDSSTGKAMLQQLPQDTINGRGVNPVKHSVPRSSSLVIAPSSQKIAVSPTTTTALTSRSTSTGAIAVTPAKRQLEQHASIDNRHRPLEGDSDEDDIDDVLWRPKRKSSVLATQPTTKQDIKLFDSRNLEKDDEEQFPQAKRSRC